MAPITILATGILIGFVLGTIFWAIWAWRAMKP